MLGDGQKSSPPPLLTRGERELLKHVRAAGEEGLFAEQLEAAELDSIRRSSVRVLVSRMVRKGVLYGKHADIRRYRVGRPRLVYRETRLGKEVVL